MSSISGSSSSDSFVSGFSSDSFDSGSDDYESYDSASSSSELSAGASETYGDDTSTSTTSAAVELELDSPDEERDGSAPTPEKFGLPENNVARGYVMAGMQDGTLDDGMSCRPDPDRAATATGSVQGSITVQDGQGILGALQAAGVPRENLNAAYGSLVANGQLGPNDFEGATPVVRPGRQFQLDSADFTKENAKLGGRLIGNEHANRVAAGASAILASRGTEAERDAHAGYRTAPAAQQRPSTAVMEADDSGLSIGRLRDQVASTTLILAQPAIKAVANAASWVGFNVDAEAVGDNIFGAASDLISRSNVPLGSDKISFDNAMGMRVAPLGIEKYDHSNITYHDYRLDVSLCNRSEAFCTIPNLSPLVDHSSAPKADWSGFKAMENGPQKLIMGHPIIHRSDYETGHFTNQTTSAHVFHSGTVDSQLYWKGDELHLRTTGYGYGQTPLHTVANYGVGYSYFSLWQAAVKLDVQAIRMFNPH